MSSNNSLDQLLRDLAAPVAPNQLPESEEEFLAELRRRIALAVEQLIHTQMEKLLQILYRIDVHSSIVDRAFALGTPRLIAQELAHAIVERELKKKRR